MALHRCYTPPCSPELYPSKLKDYIIIQEIGNTAIFAHVHFCSHLDKQFRRYSSTNARYSRNCKTAMLRSPSNGNTRKIPGSSCRTILQTFREIERKTYSVEWYIWMNLQPPAQNWLSNSCSTNINAFYARSRCLKFNVSSHRDSLF